MTKPDDQTGGETGEGSQGGETRVASELARVKKNRDSILNEKRQLEARITELESAAEERAADKERADGELSKINERLEKKLEKLTQERDDLRTKYDGQIAKGRQDALVERVSLKTGVTNRVLLRALVREAAESGSIESTPDTIDDDFVADVVSAIAPLAPEAFKPGKGTATPVPGMNRGIKPPTELPEASDWQQRILAKQKEKWGDPVAS